MYVRAISMRLSRGTSTPAIRAITRRLPLSLLVFRVHADHSHRPVALDDLAVLAQALDRCSDLHPGDEFLMVGGVGRRWQMLDASRGDPWTLVPAVPRCVRAEPGSCESPRC